MRFIACLIFALVLLLLPARGVAQDISGNELGLPYFSEHFTPEEYHAFYQNWAVVQDKRGFIYIGNGHGILQFDGASWRIIPDAPRAIVRSLAVDKAGTVYVGMQGDFGYLRPDQAGTLRYVSLAGHVDEEARGLINDVWAVHASDEGVYFQTRRLLFRWDGEEMQQWSAESVFHTSFLIDGRFFVREVGRGLLEVTEEGLVLAPGGANFADVAIYTMTPYDSGRILIGTRTQGFLLYEDDRLTPFPTEADALLSRHMLYSGCLLPGGDVALATFGGGVILIDKRGHIVRVLKQGAGLPDDYVNALYPDNQGGLWMALNSQGIVRVNVSSELTAFDRKVGLSGAVKDILRHQGTLYAGTSDGLFRLVDRPFHPDSTWQPASFSKIPGVDEMVMTLASAGEDLLAGTRTRILLIRNGEIIDVIQANTFDLVVSEKHTGRVYAGLKEGLRVLEGVKDGQLAWVGDVVNLTEEEIRSIAEQEDGTVWLSTATGDILRIQFPDGTGREPIVQRFGAKDGLPGEPMYVNVVNGDLRFSSWSGVFQFMREGDTVNDSRFVRDGRFSHIETAQDTLLMTEPDLKGNLWLGYKDRVDVARLRTDGSYVKESPVVLQFARNDLEALYPEPNGVTWLADGDALLRLDPNMRGAFEQAFTAHVRRVSLAGSDSVVFGGAFQTESGMISPEQVDALTPVFNYDQNGFVIEFAAPSYNGTDKNQYQWYLEGKDKDWSPWSSRTGATYTNLKEGTFRFHVRARNGQGQISSAGTFTFRRLPPWYRTWWAYGLYLVVATVMTVLAMHYRKVILENRLAREQAEQLARERLANERLQHANVRLHEANERLQQADRLKDEFLTNTSHELRTPITAILGFTSVLKEEVPDEYHEFLDIIDENSKRLLHTVSSLLDLAKLKAGVVEMFEEPVDVGAQVAEVTRLLSPLAHRKQIDLNVVHPPEPVFAFLDRQCFERILYNLIGNAIKFTETGGVTIYVDRISDDVQVRVVDTGMGMDEAFIPYLFEEFRQESTGLARSHEGSGLGLAITARLTKLMGGLIHVESRKEEGSVFTVTFPAHMPVGEPVAEHA